MPCQDADPKARPAHPLRNDADNGGTAAPTPPESHQPPVPKVPCAPTGSVHPETSASCGPVATSSGSSIRPLAGAKDRTTRVLPNPDNSCAYDNSQSRILTNYTLSRILCIWTSSRAPPSNLALRFAEPAAHAR